MGPSIIVNNGLDGILVNCPDTTITGGQFTANGRRMVTGRSNGF